MRRLVVGSNASSPVSVGVVHGWKTSSLIEEPSATAVPATTLAESQVYALFAADRPVLSAPNTRIVLDRDWSIVALPTLALTSTAAQEIPEEKLEVWELIDRQMEAAARVSGVDLRALARAASPWCSGDVTRHGILTDFEVEQLVEDDRLT